MRVLFLTNNPLSTELYRWLKEREGEVLLHEGRVSADLVRTRRIEFLVSYNYRYLIPPEVTGMFSEPRIVNLHISLLPWNRGAYPNVWSFVDDTPKGVTIHVVDEGIDTGDILLQKEVFLKEGEHTLRSSYELLHREIQKLFKENWDLIRNLRIEPRPQEGRGTFHTKEEFRRRIKPLIEDKGWDIPVIEFKERVRRALRWR